MENEKLSEKMNIGIEEIKQIKMTSGEKAHMLKNVLGSASSIKKPIRSPWSVYSYAYVSMLSILVVVFGGAVFASGNSLPGDILYPFKVNVVESVRSALIFSPEAKAQNESSLAVQRLVEAETLVSQGKLDVLKEQELNTLLVNHANAFNKAINDIPKDQPSSEKLDNIITNFQAGMNAHAQLLDILETNKKDTSNNISNGGQTGNKNNKISNTARDNVNKMQDNLKNKDSKGNSQNNKDKKRKDTVQSLINDTTTDVNRAAFDIPSSATTSTEQKIINDTNRKLDQAKQFLQQADDQEKQGDSKSAHSSILNSESSAKEADILLKAGLKFKD